MIKNNKNSFWKNLFFSPLFLFLGIIFLTSYFFSISKETYRHYKISKEIDGLKQEIKNLEEKKTQSKELIQYLKTESFQERQARLELGMKKPDENVVILPNVALKETEDKDEFIDINLQKNKKDDQETINPVKWWRYFLK